MSMKIVEDRFGKVLSFEPSRSHGWRRFVGLYLFAGVPFLWLVLAFVLIRDPEIGWVTKVILLAVAALVAGLLAHFIQALLTPRSGVLELRLDRSDDSVTLTRHSIFRRPQAQVHHLSDLSRVRLQATGSPSISLGTLFAGARSARTQGGLDEEKLVKETLSSMPLEFRLLMVFDSTTSGFVREDIRLGVEGVASEVEAIVLAFRLAATCGLDHQKVYTLPRVGLEVQLSRQHSPGLDPMPDTEERLPTVAEQSLESAGPAPFDPDSFKADFRIEEWSPGQSVVFERVPSKARFLALPFTPLVLVGPYLLLLAEAGSTPFNTLGIVVFSGLGLILGGIAIAIVRIPHRRVEFDWSRRSLAIEKRSRATVLHFDELEKLELEGVAREGGGDSGGSWWYCCKLNAHQRNGAARTLAPVVLLTTRQTREPDEPWRQATPLLEELATALGVEGETKDYKGRQ